MARGASNQAGGQSGSGPGAGGTTKPAGRGARANPGFPDGPRPNLSELGVTGTRILAGLVYEEPLPQLQGASALKTWSAMRFDPTGAALLAALTKPLQSARWFVEPHTDDPKHVEKADFIHDQLFYFGSQSFDDALRLALGMFWAGFSWMEIVYAMIEGGDWDGKVGWDKFAWRHPATKWRWNMGEVEGRQELISVTQLAPPYYEQIDIPRNKLLIFTHALEGDNYDGWSVFRAAYKSWFFRDNLYRVQAIGLERAFMGIPVVEVPDEFSSEMAAIAKQIVETIRTDEQAGVVLPSPLVLRTEFNKLEGSVMQAAIDHHDVHMLSSSLADFIDLGHHQVGALALSTDKTDLFMYALNGEANYTSEVFNLDPGIPTLIRYNWADADDNAMPRLAHGDIGERAMDRLGRTLMALGQWGFLTPDDQTEDKLRQMLNLPEREYDFEDRDLMDLIAQVQPQSPDWRIASRNLPGRLRPSTLVPDPNDPRSAAAAAAGQLPTPQQPQAAQPGVAPVGGGKPTQTANSFGEFRGRRMDMTEAWDRWTTEQARLQDVVVRNRWRRPPAGRMTERTRRQVEFTEELVGLLADLKPRGKPERPSVVVAKNRRPYVIRQAERPSAAEVIRRVQARAAAGQLRPLALPPGPSAMDQSRLGELARQRAGHLTTVLRPTAELVPQA